MTHRLLTIVLGISSLALPSFANATLIEDFDGAGTTPFTLTQSNIGAAPTVLAGGPSGNFLRVTHLERSSNNSIAFDEEASQTGPAPSGLTLSFDFRMTDDQSAADSGFACCVNAQAPNGQAADGIGIGLFGTSTWGSSGSSNPGTTSFWESPLMLDAFTIGLDIFTFDDPATTGNNVTLNLNGAVAADSFVSAFALNNNLFNRVMVDITANGVNALVNLSIVEDVFGASTLHSIFSNQVVAGLDLNTLGNYRLIAGGRTGGAAMAGDLDNISLTSTPPAQAPEPTTLALIGIGLAGIGWKRKQKLSG